jgi:endonuclease YncB( thermonuclease family)
MSDRSEWLARRIREAAESYDDQSLSVEQVVAGMATAIKTKDAEIERLRKALIWMRENPYAHQSNIASVARAALAEGENNE